MAAELAADALGRSWSAMTDAEAANSWNASDIASYRELSSAELQAWATDASRLERVEEFTQYENQDDDTRRAVRSLAKSVKILFTTPDRKLDFSLPDRQAFAASTVTVGIFTQDEIDGLKAAATATKTPAQTLGIPPVSESNIRTARKLVI